MPVATPRIIFKRAVLALTIIFVASTAIVCFIKLEKHPARSENGSELERLIRGNSRFVRNLAIHPDEDVALKDGLINAQHPFAAIVCCSDSRVPPELIFDQGLGDLFVIRTAGNLVDSIELGSIEYAVEHLGVKLVMVMGHENCGVIKAFLEKRREHNHIEKLLEEVKDEPEEQLAIKEEQRDKTDGCVRANIRHVTRLLRNSGPILAEKYQTGLLTIVGARYDIKQRKVDIIDVR